MIGGHDIVMQGTTRPDELWTILRGIGRAWPDAVVEDAEAESVSPIGKASPADLNQCELLVYRDEPSFQSWTRDGLTDQNAASLIHIIFRPDSITWVVDDHNSLVFLVEELRDAIAVRRLALPASFYRRYEKDRAA